MNDDDRIDFGPLDPFADPERLDRAVRAIVDGAAPGRDRGVARRLSQETKPGAAPARPLVREVVAQGRRALVAACAAAAAAWILVSIAPTQRRATDASAASLDPVDVLSAWAESGGPPRGTDVLRALEAPDVR